MQRLKTRPQFQAALAGGTVARTAHFALHRVALGARGQGAAGPAAAPLQTQKAQAPADGAVGLAHTPAAAAAVPEVCAHNLPASLFPVSGVWLGAMVPKRWARRAVTRNAIKRQIYAVAAALELPLPPAAHVVRLRAAFDRKQFVSASSCALKQAVRAELEQLFARAAARGSAG